MRLRPTASLRTALDQQRAALLAEHPGYDVLFFLSDGPQIKPRLVPATGIDTPR